MASKRALELELVENRLRLERAAEKNEQLEKENERLRTELQATRESLASAQWAVTAETDKQKDLVEQIHKLQTEKAVLIERLDLVSNYLPGGQGTQLPDSSKHKPEEIEDAEHALAFGNIDRQQFNAILEQHGFTNAEIEIDAGPYPHIGS